MKDRVYCIASAKGGSGKTVLCASFASFLAELGKKVLLIDMDAATHGMTLLYLNEVNAHKEERASEENSEQPHGLFEAGEISLNRDVVQLKEGVSMLPATFSFSMRGILAESDIEASLKAVLAEARQQYDYIFIDAQAGSDPFSQIAMRRDISQEVIIVSEYDPLSSAGVERLKGLLRDDLLYARTWVLLNKMLPDFVNSFSEFLEVSKYLPPIPWDPDVVRAYAKRRLPLDLNHGNQFTLAVMQCLKKLMGPEMEESIRQWSETRASSIREPIEEQYRDAELELRGLLEQKVDLDKRMSIRRLTRLLPPVLMAMIAVSFAILPSSSESLSNLFGKLSGAMTATLAMSLGFAVTLALYMSRLWDRSADRELEEARFTRQLSIVEDRLKKLELLRKADL
jgi:septum site-determining protein MinD